jgi:transketolase
MSTAAPRAPHATDLDRLAIDTIRTLSMDAVEAAKSGHPGTPMALAPVAFAVWRDFLRYDPADAAWPNRDRFVLSCGHASMLLYSLIHLAGIRRPDGAPAVSLDEIKRFRQLDSVCAGHRDHHRPARPGLRQLGGHGHGVEVAQRPLQPAGAHGVRLRHLRAVQ